MPKRTIVEEDRSRTDARGWVGLEEMLSRHRSAAVRPGVRRSRAVVIHRTVAAATMAVVASTALAACSTSESESRPAAPDAAGTSVSVVVYRTPSCGCCKSYEDYLRKHGYAVRSEVRDDLEPIRAEHDVPPDAASCHTMLLEGYAVEGHVPVEAIDMLLADRPAIDGIGIPGMPTNAPGMGEPDGRPLEVLAFHDGQVQPFTTF